MKKVVNNKAIFRQTLMTTQYMALFAVDDPHSFIAGLNAALSVSIFSRFLVLSIFCNSRFKALLTVCETLKILELIPNRKRSAERFLR